MWRPSPPPLETRSAAAGLGKMALSAAGMGVCAGGVLQGASALLPPGKGGELLCLCLCVGTGAAVYFLLTWVLGVEEARLSLSLVKKQ